MAFDRLVTWTSFGAPVPDSRWQIQTPTIVGTPPAAPIPDTPQDWTLTNPPTSGTIQAGCPLYPVLIGTAEPPTPDRFEVVSDWTTGPISLRYTPRSSPPQAYVHTINLTFSPSLTAPLLEQQVWVDLTQEISQGTAPVIESGGLHRLASSRQIWIRVPSETATAWSEGDYLDWQGRRYTIDSVSRADRRVWIVSATTTVQHRTPPSLIPVGTSVDLPTRPTLTLSSTTQTSLTVRWSAITGATSYRYRIARSQAALADQIGSLTTETTAEFDSLASASTYYIQVQAITAVGTGPWSEALSATTAATRPVHAPTVSISRVTTSSATVSWTSVAGATGYRYRYSTGTPTGNGTPTANLSVNIIGTSGRTYYVEVAAENAAGIGPWSTRQSFTLASVAPSTAPSISITAVTTTSATISIGFVSGATSYEYRLGSGAWTSTSSRQVILSGLTPNRSYSISARGRNSAGPGPSQSASFTTSANRPASAPSVSVSSITSSSATLTITAVTGATGYRYRLTTGTPSGSGTASGRTVSLTGLNRYTTYYLQVAATNAAGTGPWSSTTSFRTLDLAPSVAPSLSVNSITNTSVRLAIGAVARATSYEFQSTTTQNSWTRSWEVLGTNRAPVISSLGSNLTHWIRVRARNSAGAGPSSAAVRFTTLNQAPSAAPTISVGTLTQTTAAISWSAVSGATSYRYRFRKGSTPTGTGTSTTSRSATLTVSAGTWYVQVAAVSSGGQSAWSSSTTITIPAVPTAPTNVRITSGWVSWSPVAGASTYQLQVSTHPPFDRNIYLNSTANNTGRGWSDGGGPFSLTTFYARVRARNSVGSWGAWSSTVSTTYARQ